ncbi:MAG: hypothetical protein LBI04_00155 [Treponema sp.]|jgi:hypothetical protein|nr:hypothetical protein [Treponema sp.]
MNNKKILLFVLAFTLCCITGCTTTKAVLYSFADNESENGTAVISFGEGVYLIGFEDVDLPKPEEKTYWDPIMFPAERPLKLTVHVHYDSNYSSSGSIVDIIILPITLIDGVAKSANRDIIFECPALEAGKEYILTFKSKAFAKDYLLLRDKKTKKQVYKIKFRV